ncbi:MAG: YggT family protein [Bacillota bacterium]
MGLLIWLVNTAFTIVNWLIIIRVIVSWVQPNSANPQWRKFLTFVYRVTEPILGPIRRLLPMQNFGIDFSPLIALFALMIIRNFLISLLRSMMFGI